LIIEPKNEAMRIRISCIYFLMLIFSLTQISCKRDNRDDTCDTPHKIHNIKLSQNVEDSIYEFKFDSINLTIYTEWNYVGDVWCDPNPVLVDYYKTIEIITLNEFNLTYNSLDTITNNFNIEYLKVDNRGMPEYEDYNSFYELFQTYQSKPIAYGLSMKLISPPDSIRQLRLKVIINLWDNREFVLESKPIIIKP